MNKVYVVTKTTWDVDKTSVEVIAAISSMEGVNNFINNYNPEGFKVAWTGSLENGILFYGGDNYDRDIIIAIRFEEMEEYEYEL